MFREQEIWTVSLEPDAEPERAARIRGGAGSLGWSPTGSIAYSNDNAVTFTPVANAFFTRALCVAYGNGRWLAGGSGGTHALAKSDTGITWTGVDGAPFPQGCVSITYHAGTQRWVAAGQSGDLPFATANTVAYSDDNGDTWQYAAQRESGGFLFSGEGSAIGHR